MRCLFLSAGLYWSLFMCGIVLFRLCLLVHFLYGLVFGAPRKHKGIKEQNVQPIGTRHASVSEGVFLIVSVRIPMPLETPNGASGPWFPIKLGRLPL